MEGLVPEKYEPHGGTFVLLFLPQAGVILRDSGSGSWASRAIRLPVVLLVVAVTAAPVVVVVVSTCPVCGDDSKYLSNQGWERACGGVGGEIGEEGRGYTVPHQLLLIGPFGYSPRIARRALARKPENGRVMARRTMTANIRWELKLSRENIPTKSLGRLLEDAHWKVVYEPRCCWVLTNQTSLRLAKLSRRFALRVIKFGSVLFGQGRSKMSSSPRCTAAEHCLREQN